MCLLHGLVTLQDGALVPHLVGAVKSLVHAIFVKSHPTELPDEKNESYDISVDINDWNRTYSAEVVEEARLKDLTASQIELNIVTKVERIARPFTDQLKMDLLGYISILPNSEIAIDSMISRALNMTEKVIHPISSFLMEAARDDLYAFISIKKRLPETTFAAPATHDIHEKFKSHVCDLIECEQLGLLKIDEVPMGVRIHNELRFFVYGTLWHILSKSVTDIPEESVGMRGAEIAAALKNGRYIAEFDGVQYLYVDAIMRLADLTCVNDLAGKFEAVKANDVSFSIHDYVTGELKEIKAGSGKRMTGSLTRVSRKIQSHRSGIGMTK